MRKPAWKKAKRPQTDEELKRELARRYARSDLLSFMLWTWEKPTPFVVGRHTRVICERLTRAIEDWRNGKSTFLLIAVPFRHGKSEICSVALPAYFLGRCFDLQPSVIMSGYGASLVEDFSRLTQRNMMGERYAELFPKCVPEGTSSNWRIKNSFCKITAVGLCGAITGKGGNLIVLDDYCKSRAEAVSEVYRQRTWDSFRNDLLTRQNAPASIVIVTATPWHVDDIRGRILKYMADDPTFPQFEQLTFPAHQPGPDGWEYLFPEMFPKEWYDAQRTVLGVQAHALLDCNPIVEGGNRFDTSKIVIHTTREGWPKTREIRGWDLASSTKERDKDDPDWTWGVKGCVTKMNLGQGVIRKSVWISSLAAIQAEAPERDAFIRATAMQDGPTTVQYVEAFGAYKDAYVTLKKALPNRLVKASHLSGDKAAKLAPLEAPFENGDVHVLYEGCKQWLDMWKVQFNDFPAGAHDDGPDATAVMFHASDKSYVGALV